VAPSPWPFVVDVAQLVRNSLDAPCLLEVFIISSLQDSGSGAFFENPAR
jgi:hypothetical protein